MAVRRPHLTFVRFMNIVPSAQKLLHHPLNHSKNRCKNMLLFYLDWGFKVFHQTSIVKGVCFFLFRGPRDFLSPRWHQGKLAMSNGIDLLQFQKIETCPYVEDLNWIAFNCIQLLDCRLAVLLGETSIWMKTQLWRVWSQERGQYKRMHDNSTIVRGFQGLYCFIFDSYLRRCSSEII